MVAPEAIVTKRTFLNHSPDEPDQLVAPCRSRRRISPLPFSSPQALPRHERAPAKTVAIT